MTKWERREAKRRKRTKMGMDGRSVKLLAEIVIDKARKIIRVDKDTAD